MITTVLLALALPNLGAPQDSKTQIEKLPKSGIEFKMVAIPGGKLETSGKSVEIKPFLMSATEIPWEVFDQYLLSGEPSKPYDRTEYGPDVIARPSRSYILPDLGWGHQGYPVINIATTTVEMFCRWLSKETGKKYRIPTESEWEWACREGQGAGWKVDAAEIEKQAWYEENSDDLTHPIGKKAPNKYGLFDMLGNVGEWTKDAEGKFVLCGSHFRDPVANITPTIRRRYEPSWQETDPQLPKSRWWLADAPFAGFRVVREG